MWGPVSRCLKRKSRAERYDLRSPSCLQSAGCQNSHGMTEAGKKAARNPCSFLLLNTGYPYLVVWVGDSGI